MYKRFSLTEIQEIKNNLVQNLVYLMQKEKIYDFKSFLKYSFAKGDEVYYFARSYPTFRMSKQWEDYQFIDEKEKIELHIPKENFPTFAWLVKRYLTKRWQHAPSKSIVMILADAFAQGEHNKIFDKPYLVYDIETSSDLTDLKKTGFYLGYAMEPDDTQKMQYEYIAQQDIKQFVQKMLDFDWYIIGFNNIWFDNVVSVYNAGLSETELQKINEKSLDLFLFVRNLTGKRIWLNKIAQALVSIEKTLDVGTQWDQLWTKYLQTWDKNHLEEFKKYCKNDVKMTALVMLYMLHYKKISIDGEEYSYTLEDFISLAHKPREKAKETTKHIEKSMFA